MEHLDLRSGSGSGGEVNPTQARKDKQHKIIVMVCAGISLTIFVTLTICFARYTFKNPDPDNCWVVRDLDGTAKTRDAVLKRAK